ncbi:hypothetical protein SDRG_16656 [Saprolegnia diclina VS20]|uniref:Amino acid transporter n=1 Tax=Saprolegnia diclina (strain VS20) TaxID=1156394 RepID=T0PWU8_SAPDV|nr:hypothetical protein SDRG_16656 [Saprolegnia diclina VS20]EQC25485.1 hypothetical protein SDRG_16656 [Saprolegnia diclina VS20]|eukprot:XP_008621094.1 hypothetical protein SDRG_16656 [Saprolegnia diclina VS20]
MGKKGIYLYYETAPTAPSPEPIGHHLLHATPESISSASSSRSGDRRPPPPAAPLGVRTDFSSRGQPSLLVYDDPVLEDTNDVKHLATGNFDARSSSVFVNSIAVVVGTGVGVGLGFLLATLDIGREARQWMALPGDLFVRALRCLIVPLVFCSMTVSIAEVVLLNRTSVLTLRTALVFFLTSSLAVVQGMVVALVFRAMYIAPDITASTAASSSAAIIGLKCANGLFLGAAENGSIACIQPNVTLASLYEINDINNVLNLQGKFQQLSLTDQVIAIIYNMVSDNIFHSLANGSLLSIIVFALPLGFAVAKSHSGDASSNGLLNLLRQSRNALLSLINNVLALTPIAVCFLVSSSVLTYNANASNFVSQAGYLVLAFVSGVVCHVFLALPLLLFLFTRINPYNYLRQLFPAYVFAFGCSSSMAALPVAMTVVHQTRQVSRGFGRLVLCLGTPVNTNASGLYYPLMTTFLAISSGSSLETPQLVVLFFVSLLGCMGTAPVPNASLVMLVTVWKTVFPNATLPTAFVSIVAIDVLLDRICTMVNLNGNMVATRILAAHLDDATSWSSGDEHRTEAVADEGM